MAIVYKLKTPIEVSGNKIDSVTLEEPTFGMIAEIGVPTDAVDSKANMKMLRDYVVKCSGLPTQTIDQMKIGDALALVQKISGFFTVGE